MDRLLMSRIPSSLTNRLVSSSSNGEVREQVPVEVAVAVVCGGRASRNKKTQRTDTAGGKRMKNEGDEQSPGAEQEAEEHKVKALSSDARGIKSHDMTKRTTTRQLTMLQAMARFNLRNERKRRGRGTELLAVMQDEDQAKCVKVEGLKKPRVGPEVGTKTERKRLRQSHDLAPARAPKHTLKQHGGKPKKPTRVFQRISPAKRQLRSREQNADTTEEIVELPPSGKDWQRLEDALTTTPEPDYMEELTNIDKAWYRNHLYDESGDEEKVVTIIAQEGSMKRETVIQGSIKRLYPLTWLNDELVNAFISILNRHYQDAPVIVFSSLFYTNYMTLAKKNNEKEEVYSILGKWITRMAKAKGIKGKEWTFGAFVCIGDCVSTIPPHGQFFFENKKLRKCSQL